MLALLCPSALYQLSTVTWKSDFVIDTESTFGFEADGTALLTVSNSATQIVFGLMSSRNVSF
jgi:hypothetical protein